MKRVVTILLSLAALTGLLIFGAGWVLSGAPMPAIPPARTAAPDGFDATAYVDMAALSSTEQATVLDLNEFGGPFEHYTIPDLGVTYFILFTPDDQERVLFVNNRGAVIGDITDQRQLFPMDHFMVTLDGYYEVMAEGVSGRQPLVEVSVDSPTDLARMITESSQYRSYSGTDVPGNDLARGINTRLHVMRLNGVWTRVATDDPTYYDWKGAPFHDLDAQYRISRPGQTNSVPDFFGGRYRVELTHFDQQDYLPRRGAPMGSTTGQGRPAQWVGTGYYTVFIDDTPALRFRIENDRELLSGSGPIYLIVHGGAALDFIVIEHTERNGDKRVLIVSTP